MIVEVLNTSDSFWLPFYSLNDKFYESPGYLLLGVLQITIYCVTAYVIIRTCTIFLTIKVFHENMNILMAWFLFQWFEAILAKMIILPYQCGLVIIGSNPQRTYYSWWTDNKQDIVVIQNRSDITPLYIACLFLWHYVYSVIFAIVIAGSERLFATFYISDYESVRRRHIPAILIVLTNLITIPYAYHICNNHIPFLVAYGQCFLNAAAVFFGFLILWRANVVMRNRMNKLNSADEKYSLAKKFQVEENIRSLELFKRVVCAAVIYLSLSLVVLILLVFRLLEGYEPLFVYVLDNAVLSAALVVSITLLFCSPAWKHAFISHVPFFRNFRSPRVSHKAVRKQDHLRESEIYFEQLKNAWV